MENINPNPTQTMREWIVSDFDHNSGKTTIITYRDEHLAKARVNLMKELFPKNRVSLRREDDEDLVANVINDLCELHGQNTVNMLHELKAAGLFSAEDCRQIVDDQCIMLELDDAERLLK